MGIVLSTHASLSPLSLVSVIIGFISFAFTLGTFFKVVWTNLTTLQEAPHEVHTYLTNLRTELLEERASLRSMRKSSRQHARIMNDQQHHGHQHRIDSGVELDEISLKTMNDMIRSLIKKFREVERPFLEDGEPGIDGMAEQNRKRRRNNRRESRSVSPYGRHEAYASPPEKGGGRGRTDRGDTDYDEGLGDDDRFWAQRTQYANYGLRQRFRWLYRKAEAQALVAALERVQTRRIARQVGSMSILIHEYGGASLRQEETLRRIDERMSRIVGIRRIDD